MGARIRDKRNVKIFVLYLMQNINYPLDYVTLNDIVMQNDYVMYLDFAEAFHEMVDMHNDVVYGHKFKRIVYIFKQIENEYFDVSHTSDR